MQFFKRWGFWAFSAECVISFGWNCLYRWFLSSSATFLLTPYHGRENLSKLIFWLYKQFFKKKSLPDFLLTYRPTFYKLLSNFTTYLYSPTSDMIFLQDIPDFKKFIEGPPKEFEWKRQNYDFQRSRVYTENPNCVGFYSGHHREGVRGDDTVPPNSPADRRLRVTGTVHSSCHYNDCVQEIFAMSNTVSCLQLTCSPTSLHYLGGSTSS